MEETGYESNSIRGHRVDFYNAQGKLSWGIRIDKPIKAMSFNKDLDSKKECTIKVPQGHLLAYFDLHPQETLTRKLANIDHSNAHTFFNTNLKELVSKDDSRAKELVKKLISDVLGKNEEAIKLFNEILTKNPGKKILIVDGHGWSKKVDPSIGEGDYMKLGGPEIQEEGNRVKITDILEKYNDSNEFSVILFHSCNQEKVFITALDVPIFMPIGITQGFASAFAANKTRISIPGGDVVDSFRDRTKIVKTSIKSPSVKL